jgi:predicted house-cleaning NTP pyrophosphatase (Maf/HAM1 superfamily)
LAVGLDEMLPKPCTAKDIEELLLAMTTKTKAATAAALLLPGSARTSEMEEAEAHAKRISDEARDLPKVSM